YPVPGELLAGRRAGLGDFVFVVREDEVRPPPWMSNVSPRCFIDMAEHSMCQPGRPGPHGLGHSGSPGLEDFHSAKSMGLRLRSSTSTRAPACSSSSLRLESRP